jgi:ketosteroid isomerase-like protein
MTLTRSTIAAVDGRPGMAADKRRAADEDQIRTLIDDRVKAVRTKDINGAMSSSALDILSFDVINPLQYVGLDAL